MEDNKEHDSGLDFLHYWLCVCLEDSLKQKPYLPPGHQKAQQAQEKWYRITHPKTLKDYGLSISLKELNTFPEGRAVVARIEQTNLLTGVVVGPGKQGRSHKKNKGNPPGHRPPPGRAG